MNIDSNFSVQAYLWIVVCMSSIFEIIYVKHLVSSIAMTTWGQTYYQNILSAAFFVDDVYFVRREAGLGKHRVDVWSRVFYLVELRRGVGGCRFCRFI